MSAIFLQKRKQIYTKRKLSLSAPQLAKKVKKSIDLNTKMTVIKQYEIGKKVNVI